MRKAKARVFAPANIIDDVSNLLDMVGIDSIDRRKLDGMLHTGYDPQDMLDFADELCRRSRMRMTFDAMLGEYLAGGAA